MLELDVILERFYQSSFANLSLEDKQLFDELLDEPDMQLFVWFLENEPPAERFCSLVQKIK